MSYELDEIVPVSRGGSPYDPGNVQPAHRLCNQRKGNGTGSGKGAAPPPMLPLSRRW